MTSSSDALRPDGIPAGRFVGEPIDPEAGSFDAAEMARGEPGLMRRFAWRGETVEVKATIACWKSYSPCRTSHSTERYLRRHWYHVETADGAGWFDHEAMATPWSLEPFVEMKTIWHPSAI